MRRPRLQHRQIEQECPPGQENCFLQAVNRNAPKNNVGSIQYQRGKKERIDARETRRPKIAPVHRLPMTQVDNRQNVAAEEKEETDGDRPGGQPPLAKSAGREPRERNRKRMEEHNHQRRKESHRSQRMDPCSLYLRGCGQAVLLHLRSLAEGPFAFYIVPSANLFPVTLSGN